MFLIHCRWLYENVPGCGKGDTVEDEAASMSCVINAATRGQVEVLQWLRSLRPPCAWDSASLCRLAATEGQLEVLKYVKSQGCELTEMLCYTAGNDPLARVRMLLLSLCPLNVLQHHISSSLIHSFSSLILVQAAGGHLEMLQWLREEGCPWNKVVCSHAAVKNSHARVAEWIKRNR